VVVKRGEPEFAWKSFLWTGTLEHVGKQLVAAWFRTESQLKKAHEKYNAWVETDLVPIPLFPYSYSRIPIPLFPILATHS
jgi:hypothetical protein